MKQAQFAPSIPQWEAWQALENREHEEVVYGGAAGGGKTYFGCYWKAYRRMRYPGSRGVTCRATKILLRESTLITFNKVLREMGLEEGKDYKFNATLLTYDFANGSKEIFKDLEYKPSDMDYLRLGSLEVTDAWIEEDFTAIPQRAAEILKTRIRWMLHTYELAPKLLLTTNPGYHWIRSKYIRQADGTPVTLKDHQKFIPARVTDNPDAAFVAIYKANLEKISSDYDRARLLDGDWDAIEKTGGEAYSEFAYETHVRNIHTLYDPKEPLHLTWDFNTLPYVTCNIWIGKGKKVKQIKEITLPKPFNNTKHTVKHFCHLFKGHQAELFVYGDPAGRHEDTRNERGYNDYSIILDELRKAGFRVSERVDNAAPPVNLRIMFINEILKNQYLGCEIEIDATCGNTIKDYQQVQKASDGRKDKKKIQDPVTKVSYEPLGHPSDANDYFLCRYFRNEFIQFQARTNNVTAPRRITREHQL